MEKRNSLERKKKVENRLSSFHNCKTSMTSKLYKKVELDKLTQQSNSRQKEIAIGTFSLAEIIFLTGLILSVISHTKYLYKNGENGFALMTGNILFVSFMEDKEIRFSKYSKREDNRYFTFRF